MQGTATLPLGVGLGVGYLGLGRLTAFSETSTKPFASNIKANLTLVTFTKYSFIWRVIIAEHIAKLHKLAAIRTLDIGVGVLVDYDKVDVLGNFMTFTRAYHFTAFSCHCCSAFTNDAKLRIYGNKHVDRQSRQWAASFCPVLPIGAVVATAASCVDHEASWSLVHAWSAVSP